LRRARRHGHRAVPVDLDLGDLIDRSSPAAGCAGSRWRGRLGRLPSVIRVTISRLSTYNVRGCSPSLIGVGRRFAALVERLDLESQGAVSRRVTFGHHQASL
jgi:hypothetical protein